MTTTSGRHKAIKVHVGAVVPNRRRGGDIRVTLSPVTAGALPVHTAP